MKIGNRVRRSLVLLFVAALVGAAAYGSHWATVTYAESKDQETISSLRKQVDSHATNVKAQTAKVSETLQYLNENNIDFTTEAKGDTLVIRIARDRAVHQIKDGVDTFVLNDTTNDPLIKER